MSKKQPAPTKPAQNPFERPFEGMYDHPATHVQAYQSHPYPQVRPAAQPAYYEPQPQYQHAERKTWYEYIAAGLLITLIFAGIAFIWAVSTEQFKTEISQPISTQNDVRVNNTYANQFDNKFDNSFQNQFGLNATIIIQSIHVTCSSGGCNAS